MRTTLRLLAITIALLVPILALAQATLPTVDPGAQLTGIMHAFQSHNWGLVTAFGLMLLTWAAGRFGLLKFLPSSAVPWVTIALGACAGFATDLIAGAPVFTALTAGIEAGLAGVGAYEAAGQHALSSPTTSTST